MTHKEKHNNPPENSRCFGHHVGAKVLGTADASGFCIHRPGISNDVAAKFVGTICWWMKIYSLGIQSHSENGNGT